MMKFLFNTDNMDAFEQVLVNRGWATFQDVGEEEQTVRIRYPIEIDGQPVNAYREETFLASTVKGLTLPFTFTRSVPITINGTTVNRNMEFTVDDVRTGKRKRRNVLSFTVNGQRFEAQDDGGRDLIPAAGFAIDDFDANGWPLVNIKAVYDVDGNQTTAPQTLPGTFVVMEVQDDETGQQIDDETGQQIIDFFKAGTEKTYQRTAAQTDWNEGYTLTFFERRLGGANIRLVDPATIPNQISAQHGRIRNLTELN